MGNFLTRQIPVYKVWLGFVGCLLFLLIVASLLSPGSRMKTKARIAATRNEIKQMVLLLDDYAQSYNHLPNDGNSNIVSALSVASTNKSFSFFIPGKTNSIGEIVDYWQTSLQIEVVSMTNFIIRSAGPNKIFGDDDDIIFNSLPNDFVKP